MDYSLSLVANRDKAAAEVLILVLMDYSLSIQAALWLVCTACLNPYSNGLLSEIHEYPEFAKRGVLILILMDYSLRTVELAATGNNRVLILILMDYSLS